MKKKIILITLLIFIALGLFGFQYYLENSKTEAYYLASELEKLTLKDINGEEHSFPRGYPIALTSQEKTIDNQKYHIAYIDDTKYLLKNDDYVKEFDDCVKEKKAIIKCFTTLYENGDSYQISDSLYPLSEVNIIGHTALKEDGSLNRYEIEYNGLRGFINYQDTKDYPDVTLNEALLSDYNPYGGGAPKDAYYYPLEEANFENNPMPNEVRAIYLNKMAVANIDEYIALANDSGLNCFVIDIKESDGMAYKSEVAKSYSPSSYENGYLSQEEYQEAIKKCKDNGLYLVGRIVTFKDIYYANDYPEYCLLDKETNEPYLLANSYWPSPYMREVWEYNIALALEGAKMGFNEIQFDYLRFPDRIDSIKENIDFRNKHNEEMITAINGFLLYAREQLHQESVYLSADTFGETSNNYVTSYGQYWPMISSIVDVVSSMPYPDHFATYDYGIEEPVWTVPGRLLDCWGNDVLKRQEESLNKAKVRTWIQGYDTIYRDPLTIYDADKINEQIEALYANGLDDGYIIWNAPSNIIRYQSYKECFKERR